MDGKLFLWCDDTPPHLPRTARTEDFIFDLQRFDLTGAGTEESPYEVSSADDLNEAVTTGGHIKLMSAITSDKCMTVAANKTVVLDLNGQTLTSTNAYNPFDVRGSITVNDNATGGKIVASTPWGVFYAYANSNIVINDGTIEYNGTRSAVYGSEGSGSNTSVTGGTITGTGNNIHSVGEVSITGGTFTSDVSQYIQNKESAQYLFLNDTLYVGDSFTNNSDDDIKNAKTTYDANKVALDGEQKYYTTKELADAAVANAVASIGDKLYSSAQKAVDAATTGSTIKLLKDVADTITFNNGKDLTLDLNKHNVSSSDWAPIVLGNQTADSAENTKLTIVGKGTISGKYGISVMGGTFAGDNTKLYSTLVLGKGDGTDDIKITADQWPIWGNGNHYGDGRDNCGTSITINDGVIIDGGSTLGIYHPQTGILTINGGTITGTTGVEIRAGTLNVTGGTIEATGTYNSEANGKGSTSSGVGIAVAQHTTQKAITVNISGENTEIKGANALAVANPQENAKNLAIEANIDGAKLTSTTTETGTNNKTGNAILADNANANITVNSGSLTGNVAVSKENAAQSGTNTTSLKMNGGTTTGNVVNAGSNTSTVEISGTAKVTGDVTSSGDAPTAISGGEVSGTVSNTSGNAKTEITGGTVTNVSSSAGSTKVSGTATVKESVTTSGGETEISGGTVKNVSSSAGTTNISGTATVTNTVTNSDTATTNLSGGTVKNVNSTSGTTNISGTATVTDTVTNSGGTTDISGGTVKNVNSTSGTTNVSGGEIQSVTNSDTATTNLSGGTVKKTSGEITVPDGYTRDADGIIRVNGAWSLVSDVYSYVIAGASSSTVIATATDTTSGGLHDTQYKLLAIPTGANFTWGSSTASVNFAAAQYSTTEGAIAITPLTTGFKIIGSSIAGSATTLTTNDDTNEYGIAVDATNNSLTNITGGAGDDSLKAGKKGGTISGGAGDDTLDGGDGNASLNGGAGNDTFVYSAGADSIENFSAGDIVKTSALAVTDGSKITSNGDNFTLNFGSGKTLTFTNAAVPISLNNETYDYVYTKDLVKQGSSVTLAAAVTTFNDGTIPESLSSVEKIDASAVTGNLAITDNDLSNYIVAGKGVNTFNFKNGGNDTIEGYTHGKDIVNIAAEGLTPPTDFTNATFNSSGYTIRFTTDKSLTFKSAAEVSLKKGSDTYIYTANSIALEDKGITLGAAYGSRFNGTLAANENYATIDASAVTKAIRITGNDKDNYIVGGTSNGTLEGGYGNDLLIGGTGYNLFVYTEGADSIRGYHTGDLVSVKGADIDLVTATLTASDANISLDFGGSDKLVFEGTVSDVPSISLQSGKNTYVYTKETIVRNGNSITLTSNYAGTSFAAGDYDSINAAAVSLESGFISISGNDNANYIVGSNYGGSLYGGAGNDKLDVTDRESGAKYVFQYTAGKDTIENFAGGADSLAIDLSTMTIASAKTGNDRLTFTFDKDNSLVLKGDELEKISLQSGGFLTKDGVVSSTSLKLFGSAKGLIDLKEDALYNGAGIESVNAAAASKPITLVGGTNGGAFTFAANNKKRDVFEYGGGSVIISGYEAGIDKLNLNTAAFSTFSVGTGTDTNVSLTTSLGNIVLESLKGHEVLIHDANSRGNSYSQMVFKETGVLENKEKRPTEATILAGFEGGYDADKTIKKVFVMGGVSGVSIGAGNNKTLIDASAAGTGVTLIGGSKNDKLIGSTVEGAVNTFVYGEGKDDIQNFSDGDQISLTGSLQDSISSAKISASKKSLKFKFSGKNALAIKGDSLSDTKFNINGETKTFAKNAIGEGNNVTLTSNFSGSYKLENFGVNNVYGGDVKKNLTFKGTEAAETLTGGTKKTNFKGGGGNDSLVGGSGKDVFFYAKNDSGEVSIQGFDFTKDKLKIASNTISEISTVSGGVKFDMSDGSFNVTSSSGGGNIDTTKTLIKANSTYYWFADSSTADETKGIAAGDLITADTKVKKGDANATGFAVIDLGYSTNLVKTGVAVKAGEFTFNSGSITKK